VPLPVSPGLRLSLTYTAGRGKSLSYGSGIVGGRDDEVFPAL